MMIFGLAPLPGIKLMQVKGRGLAISAFLAMLLMACSSDPESGPKEVKWDWDVCDRCRMVLSDHLFAAQIRYYPEGSRQSHVVWFDEIGCATLWLEEQPWKDDSTVEIWVTDHRTGEWIDARKATFVMGKISPMAYGLGAQSEPVVGGLDYAMARQHIVDVEDHFNVHEIHLLNRLREHAEKREAKNSFQ
jgi:nitrous oxide reductase accessory protein NosL